MSAFEYLFTLFGLLLGLILAQVLSGLVGILQIRHHAGPHDKVEVRLGWLTPMLGVFTILDVSSWWGNAWDVQGRIPFGYDTLFGGVILCSIYYFAASMVFPREPRLWPNLDDWFWLHRRQVLGCILAANLIWTAAQYSIRRDIPFWFFVANAVFYYGSVAVAISSRRGWLVTLALAILIAQYLSYIGLNFMVRNYGWLS